jgi:hypothetical protein
VGKRERGIIWVYNENGRDAGYGHTMKTGDEG